MGDYRESSSNSSTWKLLVWIAAFASMVYFLYAVRGILFPFILAIVISLILDPNVEKIFKKGIPRAVAVAIVFFSFFGGITFLGFKLSPMIASQFAELNIAVQDQVTNFSDMNEFVDSFNLSNTNPPEVNSPAYYIDNFLEHNHSLLRKMGVPTNRIDLVKKYIQPQRESIATILDTLFNDIFSMLKSIVGQLVMLFFVPILVYLMLSNMALFRIKSVHWIPVSIRNEFISVVTEIARVITSYVHGITLLFLMYSTMAAIVLTLLEVPYSFLLAIIAGFLYLIPYIGSWISTSLIVLVTGLSERHGNAFYTLHSSWEFALVSAGIFVVVAIVFDQIFFPTILGKSVGLHPIISLFVVFSAGYLLGIVGMIFAFPVAGAIKIILEKLVSITASEKAAMQNLPVVPSRHRSLRKIRLN